MSPPFTVVMALLAIPKKILISIVALAALILLLLYLQGSLGGHRVAPGVVPVAPPESAGRPGAEFVVLRKEIDDHLEHPGTVRSRKVAQIAPRVVAQVLEIRVSSGDRVKAGEEIATLDDRELRARVEQARSALAGVEAQAAQASADYERLRTLFEKEATTERDLEAAEARAKALEAGVAQARDAVREAEVFLGEARIEAPFDGVVVEKMVEPGDLAGPGRPIVTVQDPDRLRLEVEVPESCVEKAKIGMEVKVRIDALDEEVPAKVDEILPAADPRSRTFLVKAAMPEVPGLLPGMFGRLLQECGRRTALLIPVGAVSRVGQVETVRVRGQDGAPMQRHVRTGKVFEGMVEVLSGVDEGEVVLLPTTE